MAGQRREALLRDDLALAQNRVAELEADIVRREAEWQEQYRAANARRDAAWDEWSERAGH